MNPVAFVWGVVIGVCLVLVPVVYNLLPRLANGF